MLDMSNYSEKTTKIYNKLIDLKTEVENKEDLEISKSIYRSKLKAFKHDWDKHVTSKKLYSSNVNIEVKSIIDKLNDKLDRVSDELIKDGITIFKSITYVEEVIAEMNEFIEKDLSRTIDKMESIRVKAEKNISMKTIQELKSKYISQKDSKLLIGLCRENILRARELEVKFNRIIDGLEILEEISEI